MRVVDLLTKYDVLTNEIYSVNYHMGLLGTDLNVLKARVPELKDKSEKEIIEFIVNVYKKCDILDPEYDSKLDTEMTRIGLKTDVFYGGSNRNKWNNGMFRDDGFGFGTEATSMYDDYIDNENDRSL